MKRSNEYDNKEKLFQENEKVNVLGNLETEKIRKTLLFKHFSEFLNIFNTICLYYELYYSFLLRNNSDDSIMITIIDLCFILFALLYYLLLKEKNTKSNAKIFIFLVLSLIISRVLNNEIPSMSLDNTKFMFMCFSVLYFYFNNYVYQQESNSFDYLSEMILLILTSNLSINIKNLSLKIRIFLLYTELFIFLPTIRKSINIFSTKVHIAVYTINGILLLSYFVIFKVWTKLILIGCFNGFVILIYPLIFNYFRKRDKQVIKGKWDLPEVVSYY